MQARQSVAWIGGGVVLLALLTVGSAGESTEHLVRKQLRNLPAAGDEPRLPIADRVWPSRFDRPHICLWKDDALGAVSVTIDDNTAPDHEWWLEQGERYGFQATWFVVTCLMQDERPGYQGHGYHGTWEAFRKLHKHGHDVQSHTVTHVNRSRGYDPDDPQAGIDAEYRKSQALIEREIPGQRVLTLAYPGGSYQRTQNDPAVAMKYYIAARGGTGRINAAGRIDYANTCSIGNGLRFGKAELGNGDLENLIDRERARRPQFYRGWYVAHFHRVNEADKPRLSAAFAYLQANRADYWFGLFRHVAQYAQQRDTASVAVIDSTDERIELSLTDDMDDALFDVPLTVKVRLPESWPGLTATQAGRAVGVRVVAHQDARYALIQATPDRGAIVLAALRNGNSN